MSGLSGGTWGPGSGVLQWPGREFRPWSVQPSCTPWAPRPAKPSCLRLMRSPRVPSRPQWSRSRGAAPAARPSLSRLWPPCPGPAASSLPPMALSDVLVVEKFCKGLTIPTGTRPLSLLAVLAWPPLLTADARPSPAARPVLRGAEAQHPQPRWQRERSVGGGVPGPSRPPRPEEAAEPEAASVSTARVAGRGRQ